MHRQLQNWLKFGRATHYPPPALVGQTCDRTFYLPPKMAPSQQQRLSRIPLRFLLIFPFVAQVSLAVGLTGWLSIRHGQTTVDTLAMQLQSESSQRVSEQLDTYLASPHQINQVTAQALESGLLDSKDVFSVARYLNYQRQVLPSLGYLSFRTIDGTLIGVGQLQDGEILLNIFETVNPDTARQYTLDEQGNPTDLQLVEPTEHLAHHVNDKPQLASHPQWTPIHLEDTSSTMAISASYPVSHPTQGLIGTLEIDYRLDEIGTFLRHLNISPSGQVFVLERDGQLVAASRGDELQIGSDQTPQRISALRSSNQTIKAVTQYLITRFDDLTYITLDYQFKATVDGQSVFVQVKPWQDKYGLDWLIVSVIPESDFVASIQANQRLTVLLCLLATAVAIGLGALTSRWLTQPLSQLSRASLAIADGDFNQRIAVRGSSEITLLADAFNRMAARLQASFTELAQANANLEQANDELESRVMKRTQELQQTLQTLQATQVHLIQTEKMSSLGQMVAGVAHEINNPLSFIHGNLQYAKEYTEHLMALLIRYQAEHPSPSAELQAQLQLVEVDFLQADLPRVLQSMGTGTQRIGEIVQSLRTFSRFDESDMKTVDIHEGIDSTLMILQNRLKQNYPPIEVVKHYGEVPLVECYPGQLNQVFMNVLSNAIDAIEVSRDMNATPTITIQTGVAAAGVKIAIADNGPGIPETVLQRLFDPFFTTKAIGKGTGLGLSTSYQIIVERHHGQLTCHSTPGQGAEFIIQIPRTLTPPKHHR